VSSRPLPTARVTRLAQLARVGASTGASLVLSKDGRFAAEQAREILGSLRGLAAKVGQMASYVDGFVPDEHRAAYEQALSGLRAAAPRSSAEAIRALVAAELGAPVEARFAAFEDEPFASASIGQVHRARLTDGTDVAVKVQHPGIEQAVEADLASGRVIQRMVSTVGPRAMNAKAVFDEIAMRFREELDYVLEADRQERFQEIHEGDPHIRIPRVVRDRSTRRVLTSEFARGQSLEEIATAPEAERRHVAEVLWRFVFKGNLVAGIFNADPHPGNYLFSPDGTITFLDFGCVQPIPPDHQRCARQMHLAAMERDTARFEAGARQLLGTRGGGYEAAVLEYTRRCFAPLFESPYRITREYTAGLVRGIGDLKRFMLARDGSFVQIPPSMVLMNRLQFGFYSVLARLDVTVDYAAIERRFLEEAGLVSSGSSGTSSTVDIPSS
jgi:predicted unusual protein kinase regulating ubiquinone biosynthesis (AarF/ABC1/UbiB family)